MEDVLLLMLRINLVEEDWLTIPMHPQVTQSISFCVLSNLFPHQSLQFLNHKVNFVVASFQSG
jgi:hypothetical protein